MLDLDESQKIAVIHKEGPCMVLAGPGSGKTRVLTRRIKHLIESGVVSKKIVAFTFTKKVAQEMTKYFGYRKLKNLRTSVVIPFLKSLKTHTNFQVINYSFRSGSLKVTFREKNSS